MIKSPVQSKDVYRRVLSLISQVGCMTIIILLVAGFLGRWLDAQFNSGRTITLWLILGSFPLTLLLMYVLVRMTIKGLGKQAGEAKNEGASEVRDNKEVEINDGEA